MGLLSLWSVLPGSSPNRRKSGRSSSSCGVSSSILSNIVMCGIQNCLRMSVHYTRCLILSQSSSHAKQYCCSDLLSCFATYKFLCLAFSNVKQSLGVAYNGFTFQICFHGREYW